MKKLFRTLSAQRGRGGGRSPCLFHQVRALVWETDVLINFVLRLEGTYPNCKDEHYTSRMWVTVAWDHGDNHVEWKREFSRGSQRPTENICTVLSMILLQFPGTPSLNRNVAKKHFTSAISDTVLSWRDGSNRYCLSTNEKKRCGLSRVGCIIKKALISGWWTRTNSHSWRTTSLAFCPDKQ